MHNKQLIKKLIQEEAYEPYQYSGRYSYGESSIYTTVKSRHTNEPNFKEIADKNVTKGTNLVIHPDDRSTDFLDPSYADIPATVLTTQRDMFNLRANMRSHDRIIMMGHGSPGGLMMPIGTIHGVDVVDGELKKYSQYSLGSSFVDILKTKSIVAVWCNADKFVVPHDLHGFYTGMVISELSEANFCGVHGCNQEQLDESDTLFSIALNAAIKVQSPESVKIFKEIYNNPKNPIMAYNFQRIYYR